VFSEDWARYWAGELDGVVSPWSGTLLAKKVRLVEKAWPKKKVRRKAG